MKKSSKILGIALMILFYNIPISFVRAQESELTGGVNYIVKFDVELMAKKHLANYELVRKDAKWNYGREFVYRMGDGDGSLFITVGLHPSAEDANTIAANYLNDISMAMIRGINKDVSFGDKYWYATLPQDTSIVTNIMFVRKNALVIINSYNYLDLYHLASNIDEDIVKGESYIETLGTMRLSEIKQIVLEKKITTENDNIKLMLDPINSTGKNIEYQFLPGLAQLKNDPPNTYTLFSCRARIKKPDDLVTVKMVTIDEDNVVSQVSEIKIKTSYE